MSIVMSICTEYCLVTPKHCTTTMYAENKSHSKAERRIASLQQQYYGRARFFIN